MRPSALVALAALACVAADNPRPWQVGKVVEISQQAIQRKDPLWQDQQNVEIWTFRIAVANGAYTAQQLSRANGRPIVNTEGTDMQFYVEKDGLYVKMQKGREFRLRVIKFTPSER